MTLIGEWSGKDDAEWRTELGYDRGLDRAREGLGYTRSFNKLQLTGFGEVATDGSVAAALALAFSFRSGVQTSELHSLMRRPYAVFCLPKDIFRRTDACGVLEMRLQVEYKSPL